MTNNLIILILFNKDTNKQSYKNTLLLYLFFNLFFFQTKAELPQHSARITEPKKQRKIGKEKNKDNNFLLSRTSVY